MAAEMKAMVVVTTDGAGAAQTIHTGSMEPGEATVLLLSLTAIVLPTEGHDTVTVQVQDSGDNGMFYAVGDPIEITDTEPHFARVEGVLGSFARLQVSLSSDAVFSVGAVVEVTVMPAPEAVMTPVSRGLPSLFAEVARASGGRIRVVPES